MAKKSRAQPQPSTKPSAEDGDDNGQLRQGSDFKLISELLAESDRDLPKEKIEQDIRLFSTFSDHSDWNGIPECFDSLCSLSRRASTYDNWGNRFKVVDYLVSCFNGLKEALSDYITDFFDKKEAGEEHKVDAKLVNALSMFVILAQRLTVQLQLYSSKSISAANTGKAKGRARISLDEDIAKWKHSQRIRMIYCLTDLLELSVETNSGIKRRAIKYAYAPEQVEKDFFMRFMDTVTGLLEDPENISRVSQQWIGQYFRIWKLLAIDYKMSAAIANSLITDTIELNYLDNATNYPFIEPLVQIMKDENGEDAENRRQVLRSLFVRVIRLAVACYDGDRADRVPNKQYCLIIQSLAVNVHDIMLQEVNMVYKLLNNPHQSVRMAALQALSDMFASPYLSKKKCDDFTSRKERRYAIFKKIVAHTNDEATNVRSKAVSLLRSLMENRKIPEEFESLGFVSIVGGRLKDKSVQVRKAAIQFLTAFLEKNRHGHDFTREVHAITLQEKIKELKEKSVPSSNVIKEADDFLTEISFQFKVQIKKDLTAIFNGELEVFHDDLDISTIFKHLPNRSSMTHITRYYAGRREFPFPESYRQEHGNNGLEHLDSAVTWIFETVQGEFTNYRVQSVFGNHDNIMEVQQEELDANHQVLQLRAQIQQLIDKMTIEMELSLCIPTALRCVLMGETAEVKEGIKFLTSAKMWGITGADDAIRSMCSLVWRPSADVVEELIEAAEDMFISKLEGGVRASERDNSTVENLISAMLNVRERERPSVEEVIYLLAAPELERTTDDNKVVKNQRKRRPIETSVITKLWAVALDTSSENNEKKVAALRVLFPISKTDKGLPEARSRIRSLQKKLTEGPAVAVEALRIISILGTPTIQEKEPDAYGRPIFRIHQDDSLFKSMEQLLFHEVMQPEPESADEPKRDWFNIIRLTVASILNVSMDVNVMLPKLAAQFLYRAKKISEFYIFYSKKAEDSDDDVKKAVAARRRDYWALTWCRVMEKLMAFCGEVAVQLNAYIQVTLPRLHNRYVTKIVEAEKNDANIREEPVRYLSDLEKSIAMRKTIFAIPQDTTPETAANDLHHLVSLMCDRRLFVPSKLLGRLLPIVVYAMRTYTMPTRVREAALLAYGKFMPLSAEVSSFAAPSFFSTMVHSPSPLIRCNLIAACCDFAFSQPTLFELYAPSLFRMSQDKSPWARESTILVLSHLMSNDMIQTRGILSEPARCVCDPSRAVREAAQTFFKDLNSRTDTIVQLLPEFVYRLASSEEKLPLKSYKIVFEFLIQLLKDKTKSSTDSMIDRICLKFSNIDMNDTEAPKYLLIALSKFAQNDGGLHRLQDNWRHWSKFLCHPGVAREYKASIEHMQTVSKSEEFKNQCSELLANISKIQDEGLRKEDIAAPPTAAKRGRGRKAATTRESSTVASRTPRRKRRQVTHEESDESEEELSAHNSDEESD
uniref:Condensin complex subunit 1 n=1 Tax=Caenorhabditis tropicalis TaxID=1561998 RepID=A0A1I7TM69_9PELO